jgi:cyclopropane-fatty-acyl-phospholipid synthase
VIGKKQEIQVSPDLHPMQNSNRRPQGGFVERWVVGKIFETIGRAPVTIAVGGRQYPPPGVEPLFRVSIRDFSTLLELLRDPEIGFGEAYSEGRVEVDGDLVQFLVTVYATIKGPRWYSRAASRWMEWWQNNTPRRSRENIHHHYDLGNDFYKLWLDRQLVYTCAYFPREEMTLEQAQIAKMDHICRKMELRAGESVVEAGCGWGALALHMARNYGVRVKAFNISHEQIEYARRRARQENLTGFVEFIEDDYRNISGKFDVFVSVGMLEHVGEQHYREFGEAIHRSIGDAGRGLLHFIGRSYKTQFSRWIRKRIFPGAYAPALREAIEVFEPHGYSVLDVENLRRHYIRTIEHWLDRFERARGEVRRMYEERFERAWRLYLAGSIAGFETSTLQLFQIVFAGTKCRPLALTRDHLYREPCVPAMS